DLQRGTGALEQIYFLIGLWVNHRAAQLPIPFRDAPGTLRAQYQAPSDRVAPDDGHMRNRPFREGKRDRVFLQPHARPGIVDVKEFDLKMRFGIVRDGLTRQEMAKMRVE